MQSTTQNGNESIHIYVDQQVQVVHLQHIK
jgi:hypothetical protein